MKFLPSRPEPLTRLAALSVVPLWLLWLLPPAVSTLAQEEASSTAAMPTAAASPAPLLAAATPAPEPQPSPPPGEQLEGAETEIVATQGADFDARARVASFNGAVHVADPRFELWCDRLTVFLNKAPEKDGKADAPPTPAPASGGGSGAEKPGDTGGIDRAVAEGHVVILQRRAMDKDGRPLPESRGGNAPKTSTGRAERAEFKTKTGEMTLTGSPRVQQDTNEHVGAPGTTMVLGRDSTLRTYGASRTVIRQKPDANEKKAKTPADAATPPAAVPNRRRG